MSKQKNLNVYALSLDVGYGSGLAIVVAQDKKQAQYIANGQINMYDATWKDPEKLPLQTKYKKSRVITSDYYRE